MLSMQVSHMDMHMENIDQQKQLARRNLSYTALEQYQTVVDMT